MKVESIRKFCLSMQHTTENMQWGDDLCFKIAGKLFTVVYLGHPVHVSFKCTPESFAELIEREGIVPAPYMARNKWVSVVRDGALTTSELEELMRTSYKLVFERLPKKVQARLSSKPTTQTPPKRSLGRGTQP